MPTELFDRHSGPHFAAAPRAADPAFAARPRLLALRDTLARAAKNLKPARWNEPAVFFFDPKRQAALEAARPAPRDRFAELATAVADELPDLLEHFEVRRVARAIDGLKAAALALAPHCEAARDLADLLAVPDDEVFLVLSPADRTGVRVHARGAASVGQFRDFLVPTHPAPFQLFVPAALNSDGTLPCGFAGCGHWLWPTQPLSAVPRVRGERVVLVGPAVVPHAGEGEIRFPGLRAEAEVIQVLNPFQAAEELSRLTGRPVPVGAPPEPLPVARAA